MANSPPPPDAAAAPKKKKKEGKWWPEWLPRAVLVALGLMLIFIMIAVVVSGLVLGGTITVEAKAIGLTQSLVLFSSIFGMAFFGMYVYASRKAQYNSSRHLVERLSLHTRVVVIARITLGSWLSALVAVAITLSSKAKSPSAASLSCLRADLASCITNCLSMALAGLVVERAPQPFVLPWITPPIPNKQSMSAKALIEDILGDGVAGHPSSDANDGTEESPEGSPVQPSELDSSNREKLSDDATGRNSFEKSATPPPDVKEEPVPKVQFTSKERQALWARVDEDTEYSSVSPVPPVPAPAPAPAKVKAPPFQVNVQHQRFRHSAAAEETAQLYPSASPPKGPRPEINRPAAVPASKAQPSRTWSQIRRGLPKSNRRQGAVAEQQGGKRLFDKAVEGLKSSSDAKNVGPQDWSVRVPGSFIE